MRLFPALPLALLAAGCGIPRMPHSENVRLMGASAPSFNPDAGPNALARFVVGRWRMDVRTRHGNAALENSLATYGPYLWLKESGGAHYQVGGDTADGVWWSTGTTVGLRFDKMEVMDRGRTRDSSMRLLQLATKGLDFLRVDADGKRLIVDRPTDAHRANLDRIEINSKG